MVDLDVDGRLDRVRDYVGEAEPDDSALYAMAENADHWQEIALRVLRRRRATAASGGQASFTLSGVLSVGASKGDIGTLDEAIRDLEAQLAELAGLPSTGTPMVTVIRRPFSSRR